MGGYTINSIYAPQTLNHAPTFIMHIMYRLFITKINLKKNHRLTNYDIHIITVIVIWCLKKYFLKEKIHIFYIKSTANSIS